MKSMLLFILLLCASTALFAQSQKVSELQAIKIIDKLETRSFEIIEVKTLKKWKALELTSEMKPQMNYNVVRIEYVVEDTVKIVILDMHLVPIKYFKPKVID